MRDSSMSTAAMIVDRVDPWDNIVQDAGTVKAGQTILHPGAESTSAEEFHKLQRKDIPGTDECSSSFRQEKRLTPVTVVLAFDDVII